MAEINFSTNLRNEDTLARNLLAEVNSGTPVYIKINQGRHAGSICRIHKILNDGSSSSYYYKKYFIQFSTKFDDRKNILKPTLNKVSWLEGYTGPTVWNHNPAEKKEMVKKPTEDKFGNDLAEGNTVLYAYNQGRGRGPTVLIGRISKITERGIIYCQPFNFTKGDIWRNEMRITTNSSLIKVDENLQDRIILAKLSE